MSNQTGETPAAPEEGPLAAGQKMEVASTEGRYRPLSPFWRRLFITLTIVTVLLSIYKLFNLGHTFGYVPIDTQYFFVLLALLLPLCLLVFPMGKVRSNRWMGGVTFYIDAVLMVASVAVNLYLFTYARDIVDLGWEWAAPGHIQIASGILWLLIMEATRRSAGMSVFLIVLVFFAVSAVRRMAAGTA